MGQMTEMPLQKKNTLLKKLTCAVAQDGQKLKLRMDLNEG